MMIIKSLNLTGAAILVFRASTSLQAAPAAYPYRSAAEGARVDQAAYFRTHLPKCIAGFAARPAELPGVEFDGHVSMSQLNFEVPTGVTIDAPEHSNPVFALSCRCGGDRHYVHCHRWANPDFRNQ